MMGFIALLERTNQYSKDISQGIEAKQDSEGRHRNDREPDSDNDDIGGAPVVVEEIPSFTIHREMYPPLVRLPPRLCPSSFSRARSPPQAHPSPTTLAEDLLPLETDEDALAAEFVEEEELDALDVKDEVTYEQALWECPQGTETASV
jgi:hypothetical protein